MTVRGYAVWVLAGLMGAGAVSAEEPANPAAVKAGIGEGVSFRSANGDHELSLRGRLQLRGTGLINNPGRSGIPGIPSGVDDDDSADFAVRRARLVFKAKLARVWEFYMQLAFSPADQDPDAPGVLRDGYVRYRGLRDLNVQLGQMKVPFGRQRVVSSSALQFPDRAISLQELNLDRDMGLVLRSDDLLGLGGRLSYALGVMSGDGRNRRDNDDLGLLYVARLMYEPLGDFEDLVEADIDREDRPRLALGVSFARNSRTDRVRSTIGERLEGESLSYTHADVDALFKWRGLSVQGEVLARYARPESGTGRSGWGWYLQSGYLFTPHWELAGRYGQMVPEAGAASSFRRLREVGAGLNWYGFGHNLKIQGDYFYLTDWDWSRGLHQVRVQTQVYF